MCEMRTVVLASVLAGLLLLAALPTSASAGLAGFPYQREITIQENSGEMLRDYQVLVALAGSDFPEEAQSDGDDREDAEDHTLTLPITVRAEADAGAERTAGTSESEGSSTPGFAAVVAITGLLAAYLRRKRR